MDTQAELRYLWFYTYKKYFQMQQHIVSTDNLSEIYRFRHYVYIYIY